MRRYDDTTMTKPTFHLLDYTSTHSAESNAKTTKQTTKKKNQKSSLGSLLNQTKFQDHSKKQNEKTKNRAYIPTCYM
eukprot:m.17161 g.17161  ORF g.17161 m.17161 type:complete len:77 (-) comp11369_c0_seq1:117-347(-)